MNGLLLAASLFAGGYCWVLARRVHELKSLDRGLGGAIVTLTRQIELARGTLEEARAATRENKQDLTQLIARADSATAQLKSVLAAARDADLRAAYQARLSGAAAQPAPPSPPAPQRDEQVPPAPVRLAVLPKETAAPARPEPAPEEILPKPRSLAAFESPLRPRAPKDAPRSEDDLIEALSAIAAAGGR
ncbi:MAG TPA: hypothetical protein PKA33_12760 [Amaricoccus sp.]|uniref:hypothetical protein n=2 Tax=Amaricoccus sp. TaxID=1872485 RepID=UPI002D0DBED5|nr:hypothetical protein [Amaricoccus sp.]HMR53314.1 hypothetical protein [Amaricoccus sp.]HMR60332.1 hypothetical protein [Amaricoccus sp.]HMU00223.1 hypothetical protein [Amaricoccus sp.]